MEYHKHAMQRQPVDDESGSFVSLFEISSSPMNKYYSDYKKLLKNKCTMHIHMRIDYNLIKRDYIEMFYCADISIWKVKRQTLLFGRIFLKQIVSSNLSSNFKKI